jgi:membrane protein required for colicin V production
MSISDFNGFDWIVIAVLMLSTALALRRGLVRAIFGIFGLVCGFKLAGWYYTDVGEWINHYRLITSVSAARIVAFLLIATVAALGFEMAGWSVQKTLRAVGLSFLDRTLGVAFGFARGCLIAIALLLVTSNFAPQSQAITTSVTSPYLFALAHDVSFLVPQYLQQRMADGAFDLKHKTPDWINRH